jgi:predicted nucleic acid-binding protein
MSDSVSPQHDGLLDTDTLILLAEIESDLPEFPAISAISLAELTVGPLVAKTDLERSHRLGHLQFAESNFQALAFDENAARVFGRLAAKVRTSGRTARARSFDLLIASIAVANDLPLYSVNVDDYVGIDELDLRAVAHPRHQESS